MIFLYHNTPCFLPCRNYSQQKTRFVYILYLLYFNELIDLWPKVLYVGKLSVMAEIIFHFRNFSEIDTLGKNSAPTVILIIIRNHFTASLVHRNHFCCMMKIFCIENTDESRTCLYWAIILTDFS